MLSTISSLRRLPVGTEITPEGVHFRVWAPKLGTAQELVSAERS